MNIIVIEDVGQQYKKHVTKHKWFSRNGVRHIRAPLPVGDYILATDKVLDVIERKRVRGMATKKMDFLGSYDVCVDTKKDLQEIVGNVCGRQHARFRDECILAQNNDIKLIVLIENEDGITCIQDLFGWHNPRLDIMVNSEEIIGQYKNGKPRYKKVQKYPAATKGETLAKAMLTMQGKYCVEFQFCNPMDAGERVLSILVE